MTDLLNTERLVDAATIATRVFGDAVTARWVREHCPGVRLSPRKLMFRESTVRQWLADREKAA